MRRTLTTHFTNTISRKQSQRNILHVFQFLNKERIWSLMLKTKEQCIILSAFNYSSGKGMYLLWIQMCTFLFSCYAFHLDSRVYPSRLPAGTWMTVWIIQPQQTVVTLGLLIHQPFFHLLPYKMSLWVRKKNQSQLRIVQLKCFIKLKVLNMQMDVLKSGIWRPFRILGWR